VKDKTAVTRQEVDRAAVLGSELHFAVGARRVANGGRPKNAESQVARERAFKPLRPRLRRVPARGELLALA
jgi:hypothetical protein